LGIFWLNAFGKDDERKVCVVPWVLVVRLLFIIVLTMALDSVWKPVGLCLVSCSLGFAYLFRVRYELAGGFER